MPWHVHNVAQVQDLEQQLYKKISNRFNKTYCKRYQKGGLWRGGWDFQSLTYAIAAVAVLDQEHEDPQQTNQLDQFHPKLKWKSRAET